METIQKDTYILFENQGEVPVNAFKLLGASTKENDSSKIGFWGSGLKYAIAVLLRHKVKFRVFSGQKEIKISTRKTSLGDEQFDVITVNGSPTSITTRAGKDWDLWFAIREVHCNQIDEGNDKMKVTQDVSGEMGKTRVFVEINDKTKEIVDNYDKYFSFKRKPIYKNNGGSILQKTGSIYRRGVKANSNDHWTIFDYDLQNANINESRVFSSDAEVQYHMIEVLSECDDVYVISEICKKSDSFEQQTGMWSSFRLSKTWIDYLKTKEIVILSKSGYYSDSFHENTLILHDHFVNYLLSTYKEVLKFAHLKKDAENFVAPTERAKKNVSDAVVKFANMGIDFKNIPIKFAIMDSDIYGEYKDGTIVIDITVANGGGMDLDMVLLEEWSHHKTGAADYTRKFQTFLLRNWLDQLLKNEF